MYDRDTIMKKYMNGYNGEKPVVHATLTCMHLLSNKSCVRAQLSRPTTVC